jgi:PhnB protein
MQVEPYLNFDGRCEEALDFYKNAVGATIKMLCVSRSHPTNP